MLSLFREMVLVFRLSFAKHPRLKMLAPMGFVTVMLIIGSVALSAFMSFPAYKDFFGYELEDNAAIAMSIAFAIVISGLMTYPVRSLVAWVKSMKHSHPFLDEILENISSVLMTISVITLAVLLWFDITKNTMGRDIHSFDLGDTFITQNQRDGSSTNEQVDRLLAQQEDLRTQKAQILKRYTYRDGRVVFLPKPHTSNSPAQHKVDATVVQQIDGHLSQLAGAVIEANQILNEGNGDAQRAGKGISAKAKSLMSMGVWLVYIILFLASAGLQAIVLEAYTIDLSSQKVYTAGQFDDEFTSAFKSLFRGNFWTKGSKRKKTQKSGTVVAPPPSNSGGSSFVNSNKHQTPSAGGPSQNPSGSWGATPLPSTGATPPAGGSSPAPRQASNTSGYKDNEGTKKALDDIVTFLWRENGKKPVPKKVVRDVAEIRGMNIPASNFYRWVSGNKKVEQ